MPESASSIFAPAAMTYPAARGPGVRRAARPKPAAIEPRSAAAPAVRRERPPPMAPRAAAAAAPRSQRRASCSQGGTGPRPEISFRSYSRRVARRWILPLEVLGTVPGLASATSSGGMPTLAATVSVTPACMRRRWPGSVTRVSATTTSRSVPVRGSGLPNAATQPLRTPSTSHAASSTSCGMMLWPALMMQSLSRPVTCSSPPAR